MTNTSWAVSALSLILLLSGASLTRGWAEELQHQLLFESGEAGYKRYRIPSLVLAPDGTLLAICEGRKDGGGLTGNIDLVARRSSDRGQTWSPLAVIADDGDNTLGNPCAVVDHATKTIWLGLTRSLGSDIEAAIVAGTGRERTRVLVMKSTDNGATWSEPVDISATCRQPGWTWYGTGPGTGVQLKSGRLVIPSYHAEGKSGLYCSHMIYSDDHGKTWQVGDSVGEKCGECHVAERQNGDLVLNARTNEGPQQRTTAVSRDGGRSWSKAAFDNALYDPHCEASLFRLPAKDNEVPIWLFCHPAGPGRRNLTLLASQDEGRTWPISKKLRDGDSQYSSLAELPDGRLGCLYDCWANGNYQVYLVSIDRSFLTLRQGE